MWHAPCMSKSRALELCDKADGCRSPEVAIRLITEAIRELAGEAGTKPFPKYWEPMDDQEALRFYKNVRDQLHELRTELKSRSIK